MLAMQHVRERVETCRACAGTCMYIFEIIAALGTSRRTVELEEIKDIIGHLRRSVTVESALTVAYSYRYYH